MWEPNKKTHLRFKKTCLSVLYPFAYSEFRTRKYKLLFNSAKICLAIASIVILFSFLINRDAALKTVRKHIGYKIDRLFFDDELDHELLRSVIYKESGVLVPTSVPYRDIKLMYDQCIEKKIPVYVFFRLIYTESRFDSTAVSNVGARGYCQIMPATWRSIAEKLNLSGNSCKNNIIISAELLKILKSEFSGFSDKKKWELVLSSYNAGISRVIQSGYEIPPIIETRNYVDKIMYRKIR
jgi:hypothetical protein